MSHRRAIGLITSFISGRFFEQLMSGLQTVAWQNQVDVLVIHGTPEHVALTQIGQQRVDGWLVLTYMQGLDLLAQQSKPIVTISGHVPGQEFPAVLPDNRQGIEATLEHLLAEGHKRVAFIGDTSIGDIRERYTAYLATLKRHAIDPDPALVVVTDSPLADRGMTAARQLLAARVDFTAVIAGNDWTAIGLMREFQAHGYRIPEDMAIVGFDDIPEAQVTDPPLSTVRQRTDELGSTAARLLLAQLAGQPVAPTPYYIPTTFVPRESSSRNLITRPAYGAEAGAPWRTSLAKDLVRVLLPALPFDPPPSPAQVWPEVDKLVRLLEAILDGGTFQAPEAQRLHAIFSSPPILNASPEILVEMVRVLEAAGLALIARDAEANAAQTRQQLHTLLDRLLIEAMRTYRRRQNTAQLTLSEVLQSQYYISQLLLASPPQQLGWLKETPMHAGCLGLWTPAGNDQPPAISIAGCYQRDGISSLRPGFSYSAAQFPPLDRLPSTSHPNDITTCLVLSVRTADHDWGMLAVSGPLISNDPWLEDNTINTLEISCGFLGLTLEREALLESLRHSSEHEERLANHVRELRCPVIPVMDDVVLLPLAGLVETDQASHVIGNTLNSDLIRQAGEVLLDLTGVQLIDNELAQLLIDVTESIRLAGARTTIVGMGSDARQRIFGQGTHLTHLNSYPTLALAIEHLKRAGRDGEWGQPRPLAI